jgi:transcriptional regulator with XRE-family HTH domain
MAKPIRAYSPTVKDAAKLLGSQIRQARVERRWTVRELSERAGISPTTLHKVESGDPTVSLGVAFDVATLVGVPLFFDDKSRLAGEAASNRDRVTLLPQRVRERSTDLDNDF